MEFVSDRRHNPLDLSPPCSPAVLGYGNLAAAFHIVGDHPGVHGGLETGVPFTDRPWSDRFLGIFAEAGLLAAGSQGWADLDPRDVFLSYVHPCLPGPEGSDYESLEAYVHAEIRAVTADVLLPVGVRATKYVLETHTARPGRLAEDIASIHARELRGAGWLVVPVRDPAAWTADDAAALADALAALQARDFRQRADLGRFIPGDDPYIVR